MKPPKGQDYKIKWQLRILGLFWTLVGLFGCFWFSRKIEYIIQYHHFIQAVPMVLCFLLVLSALATSLNKRLGVISLGVLLIIGFIWALDVLLFAIVKRKFGVPLAGGLLLVLTLVCSLALLVKNRAWKKGN